MIQITCSRRNLSTYIHVSNADIYDYIASLWVDFKILYAALDNFDIEQPYLKLSALPKVV
jgi:hypothetical protein